jgi:hypothetical protein
MMLDVPWAAPGSGLGKEHLAFWAFERARLLEDDQVRVVLDVVGDILIGGQ